MSSRGDGAAVLVAEEVFEEDAQGVGQAREVDSGIGFGEGLQAEEADGGGAGGEGCGGAEAVGVLSGSRHRFLHLSNGSADSKKSTGREFRAGARLEAERDANRRDEESVSNNGVRWGGVAGGGPTARREQDYDRPRSRRPRRKRFVLGVRAMDAILRQVRRSEKSAWWANCDPRGP